jgi:hypothetical protein
MRTIPSQTDNDQFPLQFTLKLLLDCDYLCCFFNFGEEQESPASQDFFHFINTFVPKYVSDIAFLENSDRQTTPSTTLIQPQHCERNGSDDMDTN